jgi:signal transduction histidine kinase
VELLVHPISDSRGTVRYYSAFIRDISERKAIEAAVRGYHRRLENEVSERTQELQRAQDKLVIQERLATLGQLAGSIAHELRNPLGVISNSVVYLRMIQPDAPEKVKEYLDIIQHETTVSAEIIRVLLDFARYNTANPQPVVIREIIERVLARVPMPQSMNVQLNLPDGLPPANIDARQIEQVIGNLLTNAIQAMTDPIAEGQPDYHPPAEPQLTITARLQDSFICVKIQDNGHGITEENQKRLFEPLFTTRLNGIGLGLALSRKLLDANQGRIEVSSRVGHGSTFSVFLPVSQEAA